MSDKEDLWVWSYQPYQKSCLYAISDFSDDESFESSSFEEFL